MNMELGNKVKELREKSGLTQAHIAAFVGVDQSLISKIEKGERALSSDMIEKLSSLFCYPLVSESSHNMMPYRFAFRTAGLDSDDLLTLAAINRIALNQFQMDTLAGGLTND